MTAATLGHTLSLQTHVVRVVHATSGRPLELARPHLEPAARGWHARSVPGVGVVVWHTRPLAPATGPDDVPGPGTPPTLVVRVRGPRPDRLQIAAPAGRARHTLVVELDARERTVAVAPLPTRLGVDLVDGDGEPAAGRVVALEPAGGAGSPVALSETTPGSYASPPTVWSSSFWPAHITVAGETRRTVHPDLLRDSSLELVDTT